MLYSWFKILILGVLLSVACGQLKERNITQRLDHFDPNNTDTWTHRYWIDDSFYTPGAPIFLYVGDMTFFFTEFRMNTSHFRDLAEEFNAYILVTEHRYYGESRPTEDASFENLRFLRTDQALADMETIVEFVKESDENLNEAKVIAAGIGQGSALGVWLRQARPDLIDGVWASSPRMDAQVDFSDFGTNTAVSIRIYGGMTCYNNLAAAFAEMEDHFDNGNYEVLRDGLMLCESEHGINGSYADNLLFSQMATAVGSTVQILHSAAFVNLCNDLENGTTPFEGLSNWVTHRVYPELGCMTVNYRDFLDWIGDGDWESEGVFWGTRQRMWQSCTEFGMFRNSNGDDHPFTDRFPLDFFFTQCRDVLNGTMTNEEIIASIERTNEIYGGLKPNVTNVYFTNGNLDPERTLSPREDLSETAVADNISFFGFAADWIPMNFTEYEGLRAVQNRVRTLITQWISDDDGEVTTTTEAPTTTTIF
ncbi:thymus-specific serine protease [Sergentomyia squamirostris]